MMADCTSGRLADLDSRLPSLVAALNAVPPRTVTGWYLTDELDDGTWQAPEREAALARYLGGPLAASAEPRRAVRRRSRPFRTACRIPRITARSSAV